LKWVLTILKNPPSSHRLKPVAIDTVLIIPDLSIEMGFNHFEKIRHLPTG